MIHGFHHVAISTPNLDRLVAFYCDVMGAEQVDQQKSWSQGSSVADRMLQLTDTAARFAFVRLGHAYLEIFEFSAPEPKAVDRRLCDFGLTHICLVVDDVAAEYARLTAAGMEFHAPPEEYDEGLTAFTYGRDVDGNVVELVEIRDSRAMPNPYE